MGGAGKGSNTDLKAKDFLVKNYSEIASKWKHCKGRGFVDINGIPTKAMLHWFEEKDVGIVEIKVKGWSKK